MIRLPALAVLLALLAVATGCLFRPSAGGAAVRVTPTSCNSVDFHQLPGDPDTLVGRRMLNANPADCTTARFTIALYRIDWKTGHVANLHDLVTLPVRTSQGDTVDTAYDPSVMAFGGETWIAFECAGTGANLPGPVSSCIAPLDRAAGRLDTTRLSVVVKGVPTTPTHDGLSASVPKLFLYRGKPYLYWTIVRVSPSPSGNFFGRLVTQGAALVADTAPARARRLWVAGSVGRSLAAADPARSVEVLGVDPGDPTADGTADSFDIKVVGDRLLLTAGVGGLACTTPISAAYGCYRLRIQVADRPLGLHVYNHRRVDSPVVPINPVEYANFVDLGQPGHVVVLAEYHDPQPTGSPPPSPAVASGMTTFDLGPAASLAYTAARPPQRPDPRFAAQRLDIEFDSLQRFVPACNSANPFPDPSQAACPAATARYCASQSYGAGGRLVDYNGRFAGVLCVKAGANARRLSVPIATLSALAPGCTQGDPVSDGCTVAISHYCTTQGYAGGFGPDEIGADAMLVTCLRPAIAASVRTSFAVLQRSQPSCTATGWTASGQCGSAANAVCRAGGYEGSYGIVDHAGTAAVVGCLRKAVPG